VVTATDLLPDEQVWVMVGEKGAVARTTTPEMVKIPLEPKEQPLALLAANTQDVLYLFVADGRATSLPVYQLPQATELGGGSHWADMTGLTRRDHLAAVLVLPAKAAGYLFLTTLAGVVKRLRLEDLPGITTEPFTVMNVPDDDSLGWARLTDGTREVLLATASGQAIRFKEEEVRPMGLPAGGVMGMKLANEEDGLIVMDVVEPDYYLWSITDNGLVKASPLSEYPTQGRHGAGVINVRLPKEATEVVAAVICSETTELLVTTELGSTKKMRLKDGAVGNRSLKPRSVMTVGERNRITGALRLTERPEVVLGGVNDGETAVMPQQLALLPEKGKKKAK
jgi:DNA gyrase subunit A